MKILAQVNGDTFLAEVTKRELEKHQDKYYSSKGKLGISVGTQIDLGIGHDFSEEIKPAMRASREFIGQNEKIVVALMNGLRVERAVSGFNRDQLNNCVTKAQVAISMLMGSERKDRAAEALAELSKAIDDATK